jgi:hypothetical protein
MKANQDVGNENEKPIIKAKQEVINLFDNSNDENDKVQV